MPPALLRRQIRETPDIPQTDSTSGSCEHEADAAGKTTSLLRIHCSPLYDFIYLVYHSPRYMRNPLFTLPDKKSVIFLEASFVFLQYHKKSAYSGKPGAYGFFYS